MSFAVDYLADHPALTPLLAAWFFDEWGGNNPDLTVDVLETAVKERLNREKAPLCLLAFLDGHPVATTAIKIREMETHPQYEHWLGNVYVVPAYRGQGIGSKLIHHTQNEAKRIGIRDLYLYTRDRETLYQRLGWEVLEKPQYRGRSATIMVQRLV